MNLEAYPDKSVQELREQFSNSMFFETKFDSAVMGIETDSRTVIYHEYEMIHILMKEVNCEIYQDDTFTYEWEDLYDFCSNRVESYEDQMCSNSNEFFKAAVCRNEKMLTSHRFERK
jgi:hypothetical protein